MVVLLALFILVVQALATDWVIADDAAAARVLLQIGAQRKFQRAAGGEAEEPALEKPELVFRPHQDLKPIGRAQLFAGSQCRAAIRDANLSRWQKKTSPPEETYKEELYRRQQCYENEEIKVMYVRNQKVASTYLAEDVGAIWKTGDARAGFEMVLESYETSDARVHRDKSATLASADWFIYTIVENPLDAALKAYVEVSRRDDLVTDSTNYYRSMPCKTQEQRTARAVRYFEDVKNSSAHYGFEFFHSYPQALKVNVRSYDGRERLFDTIGTLENLDDDFGRIMKAALKTGGGRAFNFTADAIPELPRVSYLPPKGHVEDDECSDIDTDSDELVLLLCDLYRADFVCFGYELPKLCQQ